MCNLFPKIAAVKAAAKRWTTAHGNSGVETKLHVVVEKSNNYCTLGNQECTRLKTKLEELQICEMIDWSQCAHIQWLWVRDQPTSFFSQATHI